MFTAVSGFPGLAFEDACKKYHDPSQKEWKQDFAAARARRKRIEEGAQVPPFRPASSVSTVHEVARKVSYDLLFCTETEIESLVGVPVKNLKLNKKNQVTLQVEDGSTLKGYYISPKGLSDKESGHLRKVTFESKILVAWDEMLLSAADQLRATQGQELHEVSVKRQWETFETKVSNRHTVPTIEHFRETACKLVQEKCIASLF